MAKLEIRINKICAICNQAIKPGQEMKSRFDFGVGEFGRNNEYGAVHKDCSWDVLVD